MRFSLRLICGLTIVAFVSASSYSKQINIEKLSNRDLRIEIMAYIVVPDEARGGSKGTIQSQFFDQNKKVREEAKKYAEMLCEEQIRELTCPRPRALGG